MSGGFPFGPDVCHATDIGTVLSTGGTAVVGGHNVPGAWVQLVASTPVDASLLEISIFPPTGSSFYVAVDIAVGASGSEVTVCNKLLAVSGTGKNGYANYIIPVSIPAGTRIAVRSSNSGGTDTTWINMRLMDSGFTQVQSAGVDSLGFSSATTTGVTITSGAVATKGSYAQVVASTARDYQGLFFILTNGSVTDFCNVDISIGASGSEVPIRPNIGFSSYTGYVQQPYALHPIMIPAGSRLSARMSAVQNSAVTTTIIMYGVYQ